MVGGSVDSAGRYHAIRLDLCQMDCAADLDNGTGSGAPDSAVTIEDLLYFVAAFEAGSSAVDLDNGTSTGTPDGAITIDDLLYFLARFEAGC